jgi:hypothetical protein
MSINLVYLKQNEGLSELTQANDTDIQRISNWILQEMANGTFAGTITLGTTNPIGTFVDTVRGGGVDSANVTVYSNTYTLSQQQTSTYGAQPDAPKYVGLDTSTSPTIVLKEGITPIQNVANYILDMIAGENSINSYYLGPTAPADGGTWVSIGELKDTLENFTIVNNTYYLWHKIDNGYQESFLAPLKLSGSQLTQFSEMDLRLLIKTVESSMISTGIGFYALQSSPPVTGVWADCGSVQDIRRITADISFNADTISYGVDYMNPEYLGLVDTGSYIGGGQNEYLGSVQGIYTSQVGYVGTDTNYVTAVYQGVSNYTGVDGAVSYAGGSYNSPTDFIGEDPDAGSYGPVYLNPEYAINFTDYLGGETDYASLFTNYTGPADITPYTGLSASYSSEEAFNSATSTNYNSPGATYTGSVTYTAGVASSYTATYTGVETYWGGLYQGSVGNEYLAGITFWGTYAGFIGGFITSYTGDLYGVGLYDAAVAYDGASFGGSDYVGAVGFTGQVSYTSLDPGGTDYLGNPTAYILTYEGERVQVTTEIITEITLWKRVA